MGILEEDFQYIADSNLPFGEFKDSTFLITGATGLIGSVLIRSLLFCNRLYHLNLKVIGLVRSKEKAEKIYAGELSDSALTFLEQDLKRPMEKVAQKVDYIIHAAAVTKSKEMIEFPVENIRTSILGTTALLDLAVEQKVKGMVYISSMEVYGNCSGMDGKIAEDRLGYIDLSLPRSCYPEGKRMCECLCSAYAHQYGVQVCSARLAQTFGAGILKSENRVFAQFARSVINHEDIILHTKGRSEGNYVYTSDMAAAVLILLVKGSRGEAYNVSNEKNHMTIREMAEMVAGQIAGGEIRVVIDIPKDSMGYAPDTKLYLDSGKMMALGWKPHVDLPEAYRRMISYMRENNI